MTKVVRQNEISGEGVSKGLIKIQHLQQPIPFDRVQIAVGQSPDIGSALPHRRVRPKAIAEHITFTQDRDHLVVLNHLEASGHDEAQRIDGFACVIQQITRCAVGHREVHCQGTEATVRGQSGDKI